MRERGCESPPMVDYITHYPRTFRSLRSFKGSHGVKGLA